MPKEKKEKFYLLKLLADEYFLQRKDGESKRVDSVYYEKHILPFLKSYDLELLGKNDIVKFTNYLKDKKMKRLNKSLAPKTLNNVSL